MNQNETETNLIAMTGIDASATTQGFAALLAAVFYVATYFSFVNLLRYPRNWHQPRLLASFVTVSLAAITVSLVSLVALSPSTFDQGFYQGVDLFALSISICFIAGLFFTIAAPAIAFRPASRTVEFMAKNGDHAGLWLLCPALFAGFSSSNMKLQVVLVTAMAIELIWYLRQRWVGRGQQLYPLSEHDLAVLKTQAHGDLPAFQHRHGMHELVLSGGAASWRGCEKNTSPCPFNLYVNRLGLNTAPCCREHLHELAHYITAALSEMSVVHWLEGGSLLGAVRENGTLLDWEDDIDISVLLDDEMPWEQLATGLAKRGARDGYYVDLFEKEGFVSVSFDLPKRWPFRWERNRLRGEIRADIAVYRKATSYGEAVLERRSYKGAMLETESGGFGVPQEIVLPTTTVPFLGDTFACPNQTNAYLRVLYGDFGEVEYTYVDKQAADARAEFDD
jgi:hypothetical protein